MIDDSINREKVDQVKEETDGEATEYDTADQETPDLDEPEPVDDTPEEQDETPDLEEPELVDDSPEEPEETTDLDESEPVDDTPEEPGETPDLEESEPVDDTPEEPGETPDLEEPEPVDDTPEEPGETPDLEEPEPVDDSPEEPGETPDLEEPEPVDDSPEEQVSEKENPPSIESGQKQINPDANGQHESQTQGPKQNHKLGKPNKKLTTVLKWSGAAIVSVAAVVIILWFNLFDLKSTSLEQPEIPDPAESIQKWTAEEQELVDTISRILAETDGVWEKIFTGKGGIYHKPEYIIYRDSIKDVCDFEQSVSGTFYCPKEKRIYIDLSQYRDLKNRIDIPSFFAQGYIVAHATGHHIQKLTGITQQIPQAKLTLTEKEFKLVSLKLELQADCYAGIWAKGLTGQERYFRTQEINDALNAVSEISQQQLPDNEERMMEDPLTHGSLRRRIHWFTIGYEKGNINDCNTFSTRKL